MPKCNNGLKSWQRLEICIYQVYKSGVAKVYNLFEEIWEK